MKMTSMLVCSTVVVVIVIIIVVVVEVVVVEVSENIKGDKTDLT
jgi:hypothetical protein